MYSLIVKSESLRSMEARNYGKMKIKMMMKKMVMKRGRKMERDGPKVAFLPKILLFVCFPSHVSLQSLFSTTSSLSFVF